MKVDLCHSDLPAASCANSENIGLVSWKTDEVHCSAIPPFYFGAAHGRR